MRHLSNVPLTLSILACSLAAVGCGSQRSTEPGSPTMPTGCTKTGPVVFVVSGRQNSPAPGLTATMIVAILRGAKDGSPIGIVNLDGRPKFSRGFRFSDPTAGNPDALHQDQNTFEHGVANWITAIRATAPHADVLDALQIAGRAIRSACGHGGAIYLEDSGLSETGPMSFRQAGLLEAVPRDVVAFLARNHEIPALAGITVWLIGIGDTAPPQHRLSISQQRNLTGIWSGIARAAGASVRVDPAPSTASAPVNVPAVLLVPVPPTAAWNPQPGRPHVFPDSGTVGFEPNTAVFRDPAAALRTLATLASYLKANPAARILLTGTTAHWGSFAGSVALSHLRARTVKAALVHLGASPAHIRTRGLGWRFPGYINDQTPGGGLLPGPAEHNRSVILTWL